MTQAVYFLRGKVTGAVKIGFTKWLDTRVAAINAFNSEPVDFMGAISGDRVLERKLHEEFKSVRVRGEWFTPTPHLLSRIGEIISTSPPPVPVIKAKPLDDRHTMQARKWITAIEDGEARRRGLRVHQVRSDVAAAIGVSVGTVENYRRGRVQSVISAREYELVHSAYLAEIQQQLAETRAMLADVLSSEAA